VHCLALTRANHCPRIVTSTPERCSPRAALRHALKHALTDAIWNGPVKYAFVQFFTTF
jgi:hypothetical protein